MGITHIKYIRVNVFEMEGQDEFYIWKMTDRGWHITPKIKQLEKWEKPRVLAKLDTDGLKATSDGRIGNIENDHYGDK